MRKYIVCSIIALLACVSLVPSSAQARIGVGVASGKITVSDKLKPGTIYNLPPLTILNTGDETSGYEAAITYHENQPQKTPPGSWFTFTPRTFTLAPGEAQKVDIRLDIPIKAEPGDYFAYVEGHPTKTSNNGSTSVGVAAATKLYFTISPANIFAGMYYKAMSYWKLYEPWTSRAALVLAVAFLLVFFLKFFNIQINRKPSSREGQS